MPVPVPARIGQSRTHERAPRARSTPEAVSRVRAGEPGRGPGYRGHGQGHGDARGTGDGASETDGAGATGHGTARVPVAGAFITYMTTL